MRTPADQERLSEFDLKLMDIDSEHLGIPEAEYDATVKLPASEFQRIVKDLSSIGDTGEAGKEGGRGLTGLLGEQGWTGGMWLPGCA